MRFFSSQVSGHGDLHGLDLVIALTMERDRISHVDIIRAPEKLAHIREQFRGY